MLFRVELLLKPQNLHLPASVWVKCEQQLHCTAPCCRAHGNAYGRSMCTLYIQSLHADVTRGEDVAGDYTTKQHYGEDPRHNASLSRLHWTLDG